VIDAAGGIRGLGGVRVVCRGVHLLIRGAGLSWLPVLLIGVAVLVVIEGVVALAVGDQSCHACVPCGSDCLQFGVVVVLAGDQETG
jgi:hypothetical protein